MCKLGYIVFRNPFTTPLRPPAITPRAGRPLSPKSGIVTPNPPGLTHMPETSCIMLLYSKLMMQEALLCLHFGSASPKPGKTRRAKTNHLRYDTVSLIKHQH